MGGVVNQELFFQEELDEKGKGLEHSKKKKKRGNRRCDSHVVFLICFSFFLSDCTAERFAAPASAHDNGRQDVACSQRKSKKKKEKEKATKGKKQKV